MVPSSQIPTFQGREFCITVITSSILISSVSLIYCYIFHNIYPMLLNFLVSYNRIQPIFFTPIFMVFMSILVEVLPGSVSLIIIQKRVICMGI